MFINIFSSRTTNGRGVPFMLENIYYEYNIFYKFETVVFIILWFTFLHQFFIPNEGGEIESGGMGKSCAEFC